MEKSDFCGNLLYAINLFIRMYCLLKTFTIAICVSRNSTYRTTCLACVLGRNS